MNFKKRGAGPESVPGRPKFFLGNSPKEPRPRGLSSKWSGACVAPRSQVLRTCSLVAPWRRAILNSTIGKSYWLHNTATERALFGCESGVALKR